MKQIHSFALNKIEVKDFIIDGEIVYVDSEDPHKFIDFQEMDRKREPNDADHINLDDV